MDKLDSVGFGIRLFSSMVLAFRLFNSVGVGIWFSGYLAYVIENWVYLFCGIWD
jgi:hypothetical protein